MPQNQQKIIPHLWFDQEAKEAAGFYASIFPDSRVTLATVIPNTPSGDCDLVSFELWGHRFQAISAGPVFRFNPSLSFIVNYDPSAIDDAGPRLERAWKALAEGGKPLMPLDRYPFAEKYGWIEDRYGLSWQLMLTDPAGEPRPPIIPSFLFAGERLGRAEEAIGHWLSVFPDSRTGSLVRYGAAEAPRKDLEGKVMFADFRLLGQWFAAMDSGHPEQALFNEAVSLMVECGTQEEIDFFWQRLSAVPEAEQCGWLKDRFGVSWQIVPAALDRMLREGSPEQVKRVTEAFLRMKKFDLAALEEAYAKEAYA